MKKYGTLYGVGVGPGDPELLTLKAARVLRQVDRIYAARSTKKTASTALSIITPHIGDPSKVVCLGFPMTKDRKALEKAWQDNARLVLEHLKSGRDAAVITLGDPMTYSTFGYLMRTILDMEPETPIEVVPGVTSFQAAAATSRTVLAEGEESLAVVSGALGKANIAALGAAADTLVVLKAYKRFGEIKEGLAELNLEKNALVHTNCGLPEQIDPMLLHEAQEKPGYFTLVLARKKAAGKNPV